MSDYQDNSHQNQPDFLTLVSVISHLMTCYSLRPCPILARKVEQHLRMLLESECGEELRDWRRVFEQLHFQWIRLSSGSSIKWGEKFAETTAADVRKH
ncbi:hypothetical protein [Methylohalobius crimeensis]|uniref:hypothetical protein n=1 Tax=Methylohalobius crimeensis TaxID=244365 RepID=UPI0003B3A98E|nr:hypothetical protein [Methylohalobius crimeensis]